MINKNISKFVCYGVNKKLIEQTDKTYIINSLLGILKLDEYNEDSTEYKNVNLEEVLKEFNDYAVKKGLIEDNVTQRDLFDTKITGLITKRPSDVIDEFNSYYNISPNLATDFFYNFAQDTDYIRTYRIKKDIKWKVDTEYGNLDLSINLSKPEKDPKKIAHKAQDTDYPKCLICVENEGFIGNETCPARQNLRIIPVMLGGEKWSFQYSPYVYYNEHCIILNKKHTPMKVDESTIEKLLDFIDIFPHYFIGTNAGLPIIGGSILSHEHFQGGNYEMPIVRAKKEYTFNKDNVEISILKWPITVIRLSSISKADILKKSIHIMNIWNNYTDKDVNIYSNTNGEQHNAITPIVRKINGKYEIDIAFRNNIVTKEYPYGYFHAHEEDHNIKKENIGLIEVQGLLVLPPRLAGEIELIKEYILNNKISDKIKKHMDFIKTITNKYNVIDKENIDDIIKNEIGFVFVKILQDSSVFKLDNCGRNALKKFISQC